MRVFLMYSGLVFWYLLIVYIIGAFMAVLTTGEENCGEIERKER